MTNTAKFLVYYYFFYNMNHEMKQKAACEIFR